MVLRRFCTICKSETRSYAIKSGFFASSFMKLYYRFFLILSCRNSLLDGRPKLVMRKFLLTGNRLCALYAIGNHQKTSNKVKVKGDQQTKAQLGPTRRENGEKARCFIELRVQIELIATQISI